MNDQLREYARNILWLTRLDIEGTKREIHPLGAYVAVLAKPPITACPLNEMYAYINSLKPHYYDAVEIDDYVEITLEQTPDHLSLHKPMYPRFYEVLKPLLQRGIRAKAFQFVDVPILKMSIKEVYRKAFFDEKIPFTVRLWV